MIPNPARAAKVLVEAGILRPYRPSTVLRLAHTALAWGLGTAGGSVSLANRFPYEVGLIDDLGALTFDEVHRRSNALARGLADLGVREGDAVAVMCRNHRYFVEATFAALRMGADVLYLNTAFSGPQLAGVLDRERPSLLVHDDEFGHLLGDLEELPRVLAWSDSADAVSVGCEELAEAFDDADLAPPERMGRTTILTSGTTGAPKGATREKAGVDAVVSLLSSLPLKTRWTTHIAAPLFHTWGWAHFQLGLLLGSTVVLTRRFEPAVCMALVERYECESLVVIPVMMQRILEEVGPSSPAPTSYDLQNLRVVAASGSALPGDLAQHWMDAFGDSLFNVYGSTEVALVAVASPRDLREAPGTAGRPVVGTRVVLLDEFGRPAAKGEPGRIFVLNSMLFEGYAGGGGKAVVDGMMATGDVGRLDRRGRLFVEGRDDDMIVSGGENVFPQEVEDTLTRHAAVAAAAAVGVPDRDFGQRLRAFVVLRDGAAASEDELKAHVKAELARYKVPREIVFLDDLPRNATGKVVKRALATYPSDDP